MLLCIVPVSLLNWGIVYWVFSALSNLIDTLKERKQGHKLLLFQRLWRVLVIALVVASGTLFFQIFDLSRTITERWRYQWFLAEGVGHMLFLVVLVMMMYLWRPHGDSQ